MCKSTMPIATSSQDRLFFVILPKNKASCQLSNVFRVVCYYLLDPTVTPMFKNIFQYKRFKIRIRNKPIGYCVIQFIHCFLVNNCVAIG